MLQRVASWAARASLACAWLGLIAWLVGVCVNDRWQWSQFLWWIPTPLAAGWAAALIVPAWLLGRFAHSRAHTGDRPGPRRGWVLWLRCSWCAVGLVSLVFIIFEARWYRAVLPSPAPPSPPSRPLRLLTWNINTARIEDVPARVAPLRPDVFLMANRPFFGSFGDLRATVGTQTSVAAGGRLAVISRYPVIASTHLTLNVSGADPRTHLWKGGGMVSVDKGEALLVLLDTREWNGSTLCIWFLDLPSDPPIPRARMMREARDAITHFSGPAYLPRREAADQPILADDALRAQLLNPDVLSGDCNTPRHSWSLTRTLAPGMRAAPDLAGSGWRMTFPAGGPLLAIDNTLLSGRVGCFHYGVHELSTRPRDHLAQVTVLTPGAE